jgi:hypothetical protein
VRAIATVARASFATDLKAVLPVGIQDDGILGGVGRFAIHAKGMKLVELSAFGRVPNGPGVKCLEPATRERAKGTFSVSDGFGLQGTDHEINFVIGDVIAANGFGGMKMMDGTERELMFNNESAESLEASTAEKTLSLWRADLPSRAVGS